MYTRLSYITLFFAVLLVVYVGYWSFADLTPITLYDAQGQELEYHPEKNEYVNIEVLDKDKELEKGEIHYYLLNYCRHMNVPAETEKHLVDGIFIQINDVDEEGNAVGGGGAFQKGCFENQKIPFYISSKVPNGKYRLRIRVDYKYNSLRTETRYFFTEIIEVIDHGTVNN